MTGVQTCALPILLTPTILLKVCGYQQGVGAVQSESTKIKLVFFYTVFAGIFFCLSLLPMIGYRLTTKRRAQINASLEVLRAERLNSESSGVEEEIADNGITEDTAQTAGDPIEKGFEDAGENVSENIKRNIEEDGEESDV